MGIEPWIYHETKRLKKKGLAHKEAFDYAIAMYDILTDLTKLIPVGDSPKIVNDLQQKGFPVIALTKRSIPVIDKTIKQLKVIGIDFSKNDLCDHDIDVMVTHMGRFSKGIIFTGYNDKGKMLFNFFEKINFVPQKIIFVDDRMKNVVSVDKAARIHNIPYVGIRFSLLDKVKKDFDLQVVEKNVNALKIKLGINPLNSVVTEKKQIPRSFDGLRTGQAPANVKAMACKQALRQASTGRQDDRRGGSWFEYISNAILSCARKIFNFFKCLLASGF